MVNISYQQIKQPRNVLKLFGNVNEYKVSKFEACNRDYFCLQYSALYVFAQAWNMQVCVHYCVYVSARTCYLWSRFIFRQILFNVAFKASSRVQINVGGWQHGFPTTVIEEVPQFF